MCGSVKTIISGCTFKIPKLGIKSHTSWSGFKGTTETNCPWNIIFISTYHDGYFAHLVFLLKIHVLSAIPWHCIRWRAPPACYSPECPFHSSRKAPFKLLRRILPIEFYDPLGLVRQKILLVVQRVFSFVGSALRVYRSKLVILKIA